MYLWQVWTGKEVVERGKNNIKINLEEQIKK
jgi:hypothetical protein